MVCTFAVKVTGLPLITGFGEAVSVVVVVPCAAASGAATESAPKTAKREVMESKGFIRLILESVIELQGALCI